MDFALALTAFLLLLPIFIVVSILLALFNRGTPYFFQRRPGFQERSFYVIKFKTMNDRRDQNGNLLSDQERLTKIGKFVRKTSLDEIPQLINVIKGDMSLVGPRPLLMEYLTLYSSQQARRHEVRPGITGWAQVNGRNAISWKKKFELDVFYVDNISVMLDIKIIALTVKNVLTARDINSATAATMEKFTGE